MKEISHSKRRATLLASVLAGALALPLAAQAADPIKIGVIAETSAISGVAIPNGAKLAAEEINKAGGINGRMIEIVEYDDHNSAADAVRAFQRAGNQDKVVAVIASYVSEVVLALQPWSARMKLPMITPGAASDVITQRVHDDYANQKYVFHGYLASTQIADAVCEAGKDILVTQMKVKTAVVMSEDAAWTVPLDEEYLKCLSGIGIKVVDHIRLSPDTTDFTPIFNKVEGLKPDVIVTGISHVGVQPTVQWQQQQVPKTIPCAQAYEKKYGITPGYAGYTAYDDVYMYADAIKRAGSTEPDKLVAAMEKTDWVGTIGRIQFLGQDSKFTHGMKIGPGFVSGLMVQWQGGKTVTVWPADAATGKLRFPANIKLGN